MSEERVPEGLEVEEYKRELIASMRFAICVADFYEDLAERLVKGARDGFEKAGVDRSTVLKVAVSGAFELPLVAKMLAESTRFDGIACLGAVIRGDTDHYDFVCAETARGIQDVQLSTGVPCSFGVITCDEMEQALERAGGDKRDQGRNAAVAAVRTALMMKEFKNGMVELR